MSIFYMPRPFSYTPDPITGRITQDDDDCCFSPTQFPKENTQIGEVFHIVSSMNRATDILILSSVHFKEDKNFERFLRENDVTYITFPEGMLSRPSVVKTYSRNSSY